MTTTQQRPGVKTETNGARKESKLKARAPELTTPGKTKGLIYGPSGVGKTWFTLSFPRPYYIDTEGGADLKHYQERLKSAGGAYMGPEDGALDCNAIVEQMQALCTEEHDYRTLIIDSVTKLYQTAIAIEQERLGDKDAFGASKKPAIQAMRRIVTWASRLDMNIWFVAHETAEWGLDPKTGNRTEVGKIPDAWDKLIYELDLGLWAQKKASNVRVAVVKKSRLIGFPDADIFPLDYEDFASRYGKDFIEAETKKIVMATAQQVGEIQRLLNVVKVTEAEVEKVLTKAGAESWYELSTEQAEATVKWLNNKVK